MKDLNGKQYMDGLVEYIHKCDPDRWSNLEVDDVFQRHGVDVTKVEYFFLKPRMTMDEGLVHLFDNNSSVEMAELGLRVGIIDLYVIESNEVGQMGDANEVLVSQLTQEEVHSPLRGNVSRELFPEEEEEEQVEGSEGAGVQEQVDGCFATDSDEGDESVDEGAEGADGDECDVECDEDGEQMDGVEQHVLNKEKVVDVLSKGKAVATDKPSFVDSDYDLTEEEEEDGIMNAQVEGWKRIVNEMENRTMDEHIGDSSCSDYLPSDSPSSGTPSDDERRIPSRRYKVADIDDPRWAVGMRFNCKEDFTELIRHQGVKLGKKLRLKKNDKIRCIAYCRGVVLGKKKAACPWCVSLVYRAAYGFWQIARLRDTHKYGGVSSNHGCANARYIGRKYKEDIRIFPAMTIGQFIEKVHHDMKITISAGKAKRAMQHGRELIQEDLVQQYKKKKRKKRVMH